MTGWKLFKLRFLDDVRYQRKVLGTVIDWVIGLYLLIPSVGIGLLIYADWWQDLSSYWVTGMPGGILLAVLLLIAMSSKFRSFMQEADQLFLLDRKRLYRNLRRTAFGYSFLQMVLTTGLLFILFLPWFIKLLMFTYSEVAFLFLFLLGFRMLVASVKRTLYSRLRQFLLLVTLYAAFMYLVLSASFSSLMLIGVLFIVLLSVWHLQSLASSKRYFFHEVSEESKERMRYARFIIRAAQNVEKQPIRFGKRPLFLRRSRLILKNRTPENGLLEMVMKGFIRHSVYRRSYLQVRGVTLVAIILLPSVWLKWLIFIVFFLFMTNSSWLRGLYEKLLDEAFFVLVPVQKEVKEAVWKRFRLLLLLPSVSVIGLVTLTLTIIPI